jgi:hypothetical protein
VEEKEKDDGNHVRDRHVLFRMCVSDRLGNDEDDDDGGDSFEHFIGESSFWYALIWNWKLKSILP